MGDSGASKSGSILCMLKKHATAVKTEPGSGTAATSATVTKVEPTSTKCGDGKAPGVT